MQADMRVLRTERRASASTPRTWRRMRSLRHLSHVQDRSRRRRRRRHRRRVDPLADRPGGERDRALGVRSAPSTPTARPARRRRLSRGRHRPRRRPARRPRRGRGAGSRRLSPRGRRRSASEAAEIVRVESRPAALRPRDDDGDDPPGGGHQRARRQLHQGLLHRPGDGRPASLQGQAEPPAARAAPVGARASAGDPIRLGERELGLVGSAVLSPAHGPIALAIVRREAEPGATVSVGDAIERRGRRAAVLIGAGQRCALGAARAVRLGLRRSMSVRSRLICAARGARRGVRACLLRRGRLRERAAPAGADRAHRAHRRRRRQRQPAAAPRVGAGLATITISNQSQDPAVAGARGPDRRRRATRSSPAAPAT